MSLNGFTDELLAEAVQLLICAILGYVLFYTCGALATRQSKRKGAPEVTPAEFTRRSSHVVVRETSPITKWTRMRRDGAPCAAEMKSRKAPAIPAATLPEDIAASLAAFVNFADVAQLGAASRSARDGFWHSHQVWAALATAQGLECSLLMSSRGSAPEHVRKAFFRIDGDRPHALHVKARGGRGSTGEILDEATHMLRGLMPHDDRSVVHCMLAAAEDAIWSDGASSERLPCAVKSFLQLAKQRDDIVSASQLEQLEDASAIAGCLSASLTLSVELAGRESEAAIEAELLSFEAV